MRGQRPSLTRVSLEGRSNQSIALNVGRLIYSVISVGVNRMRGVVLNPGGAVHVYDVSAQHRSIRSRRRKAIRDIVAQLGVVYCQKEWSGVAAEIGSSKTI